MVLFVSGTANHVLLRGFNGFADRLRHFLGFAAAVAHMSAFIPDDDERAEAEVLSALHDLGDAIDGNNRILQLKLRHIDTLIIH